MCARVTKKSEFLIPKNVSWQKKSVLKNYTKGCGLKVKEFPYDKSNGKVDLSGLEEEISQHTAGIYLENPNFFGIIDDRLKEIKRLRESNEFLLVMGVDLLSLGVIKPPSEWGADLVIGEGQAFGNPMNLGGSLLGVMASKRKYMRQLPGRIVGLTTDRDENPAFCFTLQTRDQFIKRDRASSNICTAETLHACALAVYLALMGREGLIKLAKWNFERGYRLKQALKEVSRVEIPFERELSFNQVLVRYKRKKTEDVNKELLANGIQGGVVLTKQFPELGEVALYGVTEQHKDEHIEKLVKTLERIA
jgi:glycine dehydrogenase subunit 1